MIEMMNNIIYKFGFEDSHTINFFTLVEKKVDENTLTKVYNEYMAMNIVLDE